MEVVSTLISDGVDMNAVICEVCMLFSYNNYVICESLKSSCL